MAMPAAIIASPWFPSDLERAVSCCRSVKYLRVQKTAATAKVMVPSQFTAPDHMGAPPLADAFMAAMSGIDVAG